MLIEFKDLKVGDEIIISSFSQLKYLKVKKLGVKSHACSFQKNEITQLPGWGRKPFYCQPDISKHNDTFYLKEDYYRDIWLVKRDIND